MFVSLCSAARPSVINKHVSSQVKLIPFCDSCVLLICFIVFFLLIFVLLNSIHDFCHCLQALWHYLLLIRFSVHTTFSFCWVFYGTFIWIPTWFPTACRTFTSSSRLLWNANLQFIIHICHLVLVRCSSHVNVMSNTDNVVNVTAKIQHRCCQSLIPC